MSRWRIKVQDDQGRARIMLLDGQNVIGMTTMTYGDYAMLCRQLIQFVLAKARETIGESLMSRIWADAQRIFDNSPELAKAKLVEFGWTKEVIESYADQISRKLADVIIEYLPEHTT